MLLLAALSAGAVKAQEDALFSKSFPDGSKVRLTSSTITEFRSRPRSASEHKLLSPNYTDIVMSGKVQSGKPGVMYGYGFEVETVNGERIVGHSGGALGANSFFDIYPDSGYTIVVLSNYDRGGNLVAAKLREIITGTKL